MDTVEIWSWPVNGETMRKNKEIIIEVNRNQGFVTMVDGFEYVWANRIEGLLSSHDLRALADELDKRNHQWYDDLSCNYDEKAKKRFYDRAFPEPNSGCWLWTGKLRKNGTNTYGIGRYNGQDKLAHRVSYEIHYGPIPKGLVVRHKCNNSYCVNPEHLELGTHEENMKDMVASGRSARGSKNANAKLSEKDVTFIFQSELELEELSKMFDMSVKYLKDIKRGKSWSWLTSEL